MLMPCDPMCWSIFSKLSGPFISRCHLCMRPLLGGQVGVFEVGTGGQLYGPGENHISYNPPIVVVPEPESSDSVMNPTINEALPATSMWDPLGLATLKYVSSN